MNEIDKINAAIDKFADAMKTRMGQKYYAGYRGWDGEYPTEKLALELNKDSCELIKLNHPVKAALDIGARAMMLWHRHNPAERRQGGIYDKRF